LGRMVALFSSDGRAGLDTLRQAAAVRQVDDLRQALHKLKGASANIGANRVAALCRQLEDEPDETLATSTGRHLDQLESELESAAEAMARTPA
ncbi:MAG: Hpt domain-containing protein, partial [Janthinobacterium lividum]